MLIFLKNKDTLVVDDFKFKCSIGKNGISKNKVEGDKCTPQGIFGLGPLYFRKDRNYKPETNINSEEWIESKDDRMKLKKKWKNNSL